MFIIRLFGVFLVVVASSFFGFLKSNSLTQRYKKLLQLSDCVNTLYNYIEQGGFELDFLVKNVFLKCKFLTFNGSAIECNDGDLEKDKEFIEGFFARLGNSTKKVECDQISHFILRLKSVLSDAKNDVTQKCRVYQTLGVCAGISIGILLI